MEGVPACCYQKLESICKSIASEASRTRRVNSLITKSDDVVIYEFEVKCGQKLMKLLVRISPDSRCFTYRYVKGDGYINDVDLEEVNCQLYNGEWVLESQRSLIGLMKLYLGTKYSFAYEDTRIEKTDVVGKQSYITKTKIGNVYPKYEIGTLEAIAESLPNLVYWGFPCERITNIQPLEMVDGELVELVHELQGSLNPYTMIGRASTGATGRQLKIKHSKN